MFGYVREYAPELKVKELSLYKAVYCGLCKSMGRCTGVCSRLTLSYDITFLAVARMALEKTEYSTKMHRCFVHPLKKRPMMDANGVLDYCARASAILCYGKILDDIKDNKGIRRIPGKLAKVFFSGAKKRAGLDELYAKTVSHLDELAQCENNKEKSIDIPSDIFGRLTSDILSYGLEGENAVIAKSIGFYTGKWIYAVDALDDMADDRKNGSYNPFCLVFENGIEEKEAVMIKGAFMHWLSEIEKSADLIDFADDSLKGILYNVIYYGMKNKSDEITDKVLLQIKKGVEN